jgi:hypothetical protein
LNRADDVVLAYDANLYDGVQYRHDANLYGNDYKENRDDEKYYRNA